MGAGGTVVCKNCKEQFEILFGYGMTSYVLTCDKCGTQKMFPINLDSKNLIKSICSCGGHLSEEAMPKCPKCMFSEYEYINFINWD